MNAAQPITVLPIMRPRYNNTRSDWPSWYRNNEPALVAYYYALPAVEGCEQPAEADFLAFAAAQWDRATGRIL